MKVDVLVNQDEIPWKLVEELRELIEIQSRPDNQTDDYHRGLLNGMRLALSLATGKDPEYK